MKSALKLVSDGGPELEDLHFLIAAFIPHFLCWIILDMVAFVFHELLKAKLAQRHSFAGILPPSPRQVLYMSTKLISPVLS